jgi:phospholipase C
MEEFDYHDGTTRRRMQVPKGDILYQFRGDVESGKLPAVSWLVAPERFSDHPGSAWYGAWYLSQVLEILTGRPEVWKKTIFILTYDENDGYFDHVPPFVPPHPTKPETGKVSNGIDAAIEYVEIEQELTRKSPDEARESPIGLGYRVPMIIASPWSRGGCVCSQVFDHTSVLRFLEVLLRHKTGGEINEPNISQWRRTVCGDLTAAFRPATDERKLTLPFHERDEVLQSIHRCQYLPPPGYQELTADEVASLRKSPGNDSVIPQQEPGTRPSAPLPYELAVDGWLSEDATRFTISFESRNVRFGKKSCGAPYIVYARLGDNDVQIRNYAVAAGDRIEDTWRLAAFQQKAYELAIYGPNGFFRRFRGGADDPRLEITIGEVPLLKNSSSASGNIEVRISNRGNGNHIVTLVDNSYGAPDTRRTVGADELVKLVVDSAASDRWYDFSLRVAGFARFEKRYAGRIETGTWGSSDPAIGRYSESY